MAANRCLQQELPPPFRENRRKRARNQLRRNDVERATFVANAVELAAVHHDAAAAAATVEVI
jgi:hypothetical protein